VLRVSGAKVLLGVDSVNERTTFTPKDRPKNIYIYIYLYKAHLVQYSQRLLPDVYIHVENYCRCRWIHNVRINNLLTNTSMYIPAIAAIRHDFRERLVYETSINE
jgi:hypothetical protein